MSDVRWMLVVVGALLCSVLAGCDEEPPEESGPLAPLTWDTPMRSDVLGIDPGPDFEGQSLAEVIGGAVDSRGEGRSCTSCHFDDTVTFYRPEIEQDAVVNIGPYDMVDGRTWAGNSGWGAIFTTLVAGTFAEKPEELRVAMQRFLDAEAARVQPLDWTTTITVDTLGPQPDPTIAGDSIAAIVNSQASGRPDDLMCSACHYADATIPYRPAIERFDVTGFSPTDIVDGRSWAGPDGWAEVFVDLDGQDSVHKPAVLRQMFFKWTDDGAY